jgi:hypothetical protein
VTHYETLGVSETATPIEIKHAYRRLAKKYHPDRNKKKGAEEKFKEIGLAYQVLGDPSRRQSYDWDLRQSRKTGAASGAASANSNAPPPPPPGFSSGAGARTGPPPPPPGSTSGAASQPMPPPPAMCAYRYLFFFRGVLVGGVAAAIVIGLALFFYVGCQTSPAKPAANPIPLGPPPEHQEKVTSAIPAMPEPPPIEPTPTIPDPTPAAPESTRTIEESTPVPPAPTSMPGESTSLPPESNPTELEPTAAPAPVQISGKWRGNFEFEGRMVWFSMTLEQDGNMITGVWRESRDHGIFSASIRGRIDASILTLVLRYDLTPRLVRNRRTVTTATYLSSKLSSGFLRGSWEARDGRGFWQAAWEGPLTENRDDQPRRESWRLRPERSERHPSADRWRGWYEIPERDSVHEHSHGWFPIPERNRSREPWRRIWQGYSDRNRQRSSPLPPS